MAMLAPANVSFPPTVHQEPEKKRQSPKFGMTREETEILTKVLANLPEEEVPEIAVTTKSPPVQRKKRGPRKKLSPVDDQMQYDDISFDYVISRPGPSVTPDAPQTTTLPTISSLSWNNKSVVTPGSELEEFFIPGATTSTDFSNSSTSSSTRLFPVQRVAVAPKARFPSLSLPPLRESPIAEGQRDSNDMMDTQWTQAASWPEASVTGQPVYRTEKNQLWRGDQGPQPQPLQPPNRGYPAPPLQQTQVLSNAQQQQHPYARPRAQQYRVRASVPMAVAPTAVAPQNKNLVYQAGRDPRDPRLGPSNSVPGRGSKGLIFVAETPSPLPPDAPINYQKLREFLKKPAVKKALAEVKLTLNTSDSPPAPVPQNRPPKRRLVDMSKQPPPLATTTGMMSNGDNKQWQGRQIGSFPSAQPAVRNIYSAGSSSNPSPSYPSYPTLPTTSSSSLLHASGDGPQFRGNNFHPNRMQQPAGSSPLKNVNRQMNSPYGYQQQFQQPAGGNYQTSRQPGVVKMESPPDYHIRPAVSNYAPGGSNFATAGSPPITGTHVSPIQSESLKFSPPSSPTVSSCPTVSSQPTVTNSQVIASPNGHGQPAVSSFPTTSCQPESSKTASICEYKPNITTAVSNPPSCQSVASVPSIFDTPVFLPVLNEDLCKRIDYLMDLMDLNAMGDSPLPVLTCSDCDFLSV